MTMNNLIKINDWKTPLISVIMSTYNEDIGWIEKAIDSVLKQTYSNFEFIIIMDNPKNIEIRNYLYNKKKENSNIILIENDENLGLIKSLNKALILAAGEFIARMDADDICYKNRFSEQIKFLEENKSVHLVGTKVKYIDEQDNLIKGKENVLKLSFEEIKKGLIYENMINHPTIIFRKSIFKILKTKEIYREIPLVEDYDLYMRLASANIKIGNLEGVYLQYRVRKNGISMANSYSQFKMAQYARCLYKKRLSGKKDDFSRGANLYNLSLKIKLESLKYSKVLRWCLKSISNIISPDILILKIKRKFYL